MLALLGDNRTPDRVMRLGLSHVRDIAERHGGRVYVESEVGRGTTVRMRLPDLLSEGRAENVESVPEVSPGQA